MSSEKSKEQHWLEGGLSLKSVSNILGIPASTLRYWDKEGLVAFERNWQNDYRQVSVNSHFLMGEKNNAQLADLMADWLKEKGLDK